MGVGGAGNGAIGGVLSLRMLFMASSPPVSLSHKKLALEFILELMDHRMGVRIPFCMGKICSLPSSLLA